MYLNQSTILQFEVENQSAILQFEVEEMVRILIWESWKWLQLSFRSSSLIQSWHIYHHLLRNILALAVSNAVGRP